MIPGDVILVDSLNREPIQSAYHLQIQALDGGTPRLAATTNVSIHTTASMPPVVSQDTYTFWVAEDTVIGGRVGQVEAYIPDPAESGDGEDSGVQFEIPDNHKG